MFNISKKDQRSLILLTVFLLGVAYYVFLFDPLYQKHRKTAKELRKTKKEVRSRHMKTREYNSWLRDYETSGQEMADLKSRLKMPAVDTPHPEVLKALMGAAKKASVKVTNLRPISRLLDDGLTQVVDAFAMDGFTTMPQFVKFLDELWGMNVEEINLSMGEKGDRPIRFYVKASLIALNAFSEVDLSRMQTNNAEALKLDNDPFSERKPKPLKTASIPKPKPVQKPVKPKPPPEPQKPKPQMKGVELVGVGEIGNKKVAIVIESSTKKDLFWIIGDRYKGFEVIDIDTGGVKLKHPDQSEPVRMDLPPRKDGLKAFKTSSGKNVQAKIHDELPVEPGRKGRLGISLEELTPEKAKELNLSITNGLLVTEVTNTNTDILKGDIIKTIDKLSVLRINDVIKILKHYKQNEEIKISMIRNGETKNGTITTF